MTKMKGRAEMESQIDFCPECETMSGRRIEERRETLMVRGEPIEVDALVAYCTQCGAAVEDRTLDSSSMEAAFSLYRRKHRLVSPQDIVRLRERLGLSQRGLGRLLDWGEITIYRYETGALPDSVHSDLLRALQHQETLIEYASDHLDRLNARERTRVEEAIVTAKGELAPQLILNGLQQMMDRYSPGFRGYRDFDFERLGQMIVFFTRNHKPGRTKLNKLLWYADFLACKVRSVSLSGTPYLRWDYGPIPKSYPTILGQVEAEGLIDAQCDSWSYQGESREVWQYSARVPFDASLFERAELAVLEYVEAEFKNYSAGAIRDRSHQEAAWMETPQEDPIPYSFASKLSLELP